MSHHDAPGGTAADERVPLLPILLKLAGRRVLVVGAGPVAAGKVRPLLEAGAEVVVVAPDVHPAFAGLPVTVHRRPFEPSDVLGAWLVVAAATPDVNREVAETAETLGVFVNAVDDPAHASAHAPAVLRRAGVTIAVSTDGRAPALAGLLREALEAVLPADLAAWAETASALRREWRERGVPMPERRPLLLEALNRLYARPEPVAAELPSHPVEACVGKET